MISKKDWMEINHQIGFALHRHCERGEHLSTIQVPCAMKVRGRSYMTGDQIFRDRYCYRDEYFELVNKFNMLLEYLGCEIIKTEKQSVVKKK